MIPVESILYKLDQKLNKLSTNEHQQIPLEDKILWANEAQNKLILSKFDTEDNRRMGLDAFSKRYHDLEVLIQPWTKVTLTASNTTLNQYSGKIDNLDPELMIYVDSYVLADKEDCKSRVLYSDLVKHGDLTTLLRNNHYTPSFEYQVTLVTVSSGKLEVYSDGTFVPKEAQITYIRYPKKIDYVGYDHLDGTPSAIQNSELPAYLEDELVDLAAALVMATLASRNSNP
jgi:hypothetical protein